MSRLLVLALSLAVLGGGASPSFAGDPLRDMIKKLQKARQAEEREDAARWLGGRDDPAAVEALALALSDKDPGVREAAASALWETGQEAKAAAPALRQALEDPEPRVAANAAAALDFMDAASAEDLAPARRRALREARDEHTAFVAARGLIGIDPAPPVVAGLLPYLARESEALARPGGWGDHHDNVEAAEEALARFAEKKDRGAIEPLLEGLDRSPASAPSLIKTLALYERPPEQFSRTLVREMGARLPRTREAALSACRKLKGDADVAVWAPEATRLLRDPSEEVRLAAMWALGVAGGRAAAAAPDLVRLLKEEQAPRARARAAETLGEVGDASQAVSQQSKALVAEQARAALVAALADADEDVAGNALSSYNVLLIPPPEAVEVLARVAEGSGPLRLRQRALQMLRNRQGQGKPVLERLRALTRSADVGKDAGWAVESIERGGPGSPNPVASAASTTRPTPRATAPAESVAPTPRSPDAEARGLAKLRELRLPFDESGFTRALLDPKPEAIRAFTDAGMSPSHSFASASGRSPLMLLFFFGKACPHGQPTPASTSQIVADLLAAGADANQTDENGNTVLMFAADKCDRATVKLLISAGAKVGVRNKSNMTALEMSIASANSGVEELIAAGARLDPATAKTYLEAYKDDPQALARVKKAMAK